MNMNAEKKRLVPTRQELDRRLKKDGVNAEHREWILPHLQNMTPEVEGEFLCWWHTGRILDEVQVRDLTIGWILQNKPYYPMNVFVDFDGLYRDPDNRYLYRYLRWGRTNFIDIKASK